jgi:hypothetical protein
MRTIILAVICILALCTGALAEESNTITLKDGSTVRGKIISLDSNSCTLETESMGRITIDAANIKNISMAKESASRSSSALEGISLTGDPSTDVARMKSEIAHNPQMSQMADNIMADPRFQQLMQDPDVMRAAEAGDTASLMSNPKLRGLSQQLSVEKSSGATDE